MFLYIRLFKESFSFAVRALRNNKLRTILSLMGVTVGIFSIIAVLAAVDSLDRNIKSQLSGLDKNTIYITKFSFGPTSVPRWVRDDFPQTTFNDFQFIKKNVKEVEAMTYVIFGDFQSVKYQSETLSNVQIIPCTDGEYYVDGLEMAKGRFYNESESATGSSVVVLGHEIAENLFKTKNPIGETVRVYGRKLTVIGVLKKKGEFLGDTPDEMVFIPANFVRGFRNTGPYGLPGAVKIKPKRGADIDALEEKIVQKLRIHRGLKPGQINNFFVSKLSGFTNMIDGVISFLNKTGWIISLFSLLVGGFGIANIMFVSVKERTNLIGIQKSLGAKNKFILFQFLFEAVILAVVGGLVGLTLVGLIVLISKPYTGDFELVLSLWNMSIGFLLASFIGLISGLLPAISASKLDPVEAIRTGM